MKEGKALNQELTLDDRRLLEYLERNGPRSVKELYDVLCVLDPSLSKLDLTDMIWRLVEYQKIKLDDAPPTTGSFIEFLKLWERNLWFYGLIIVVSITLLVIYAVPDEFPFVALRWILGSLFVLFIPGYTAAAALFHRGLSVIERFALSIGLSLALVPLVGLLLNFSPWGISLTPIVISLIILTIGVAVIALVRNYSLASRPRDQNRTR